MKGAKEDSVLSPGARGKDSPKGRHSLALLITFPFLVLFLTFASAICLIVFLSLQASVVADGQKRIDDAERRVGSFLGAFFHEPLRLAAMNAAILNAGLVDPVDSKGLTSLFAAELRSSAWMSFVSFGRADGSYLSVARPPDGSPLAVYETGRTGDRRLERYLLGEDNRRGRLIGRAASFDPRSRPWYIAGFASDVPAWCPVFKYARFDGFGTGVALRRRKADGSLAGVMAYGVAFDQLSRSLIRIQVAEKGQSFIVDREGLLVASSSAFPIYRSGSSELERIRPAESEDPVLREAGRLLSSSRAKGRPMRFWADKKSYIADFTSLTLAPGLTLGVGLILPESAFVGYVAANLRFAFFMILLASIIAILLGMGLAREIARPVLAIRDRATRLAKGDWSGKPAEPGQARELRALAGAFETMADSLRTTLDGLEATVARRTAELEVMLREILHRTKNSFGIAASILPLQASSSASAETAEALEEARGRITSMALLYDRLYRTAKIGYAECRDYLTSILDDLRSTLIAGRPIILDADLESVELDPSRASYLGILVTEPVTNACKHAFPPDGGGRIRVSARKSEGRLELRIRDDGKGFPPDFDLAKDGGFGLMLASTLATQCGGSLHIGEGRPGSEVEAALDIIAVGQGERAP